MQASSTAPTQAQERELDALAAQLAEDIDRLNALLGGAFANLQRSAATSTGAALTPVRMPGG